MKPLKYSNLTNIMMIIFGLIGIIGCIAGILCIVFAFISFNPGLVIGAIFCSITGPLLTIWSTSYFHDLIKGK